MSNKTNILLLLAVVAVGTVAADFNVRDYGAKGDGKTFDTAAVQRAIDECSQSGGGRVVVSGGTFLVQAVSPA